MLSTSTTSKTAMIEEINKFNQWVYRILIAIPALFLLVSAWCYLSANSTNEANGQLTVWISSRDIGSAVVLGYFASVAVTLIFIPLLLFLKYFHGNLRMHSELASALISVQFITFILANFANWPGWYIDYILD